MRVQNPFNLPPEQLRMNEIVDNYLSVSELLRDDVSALLDRRDDGDPIWRRAFVRSVVPLIEGFAYSFLSISHANPELSVERRKDLNPDSKGSTPARIKLALEAAYGQLGISPPPDFSNHGWQCARQLFAARDALMHPKTPDSLVYTDAHWLKILEGATWIMRELFRLPALMHTKFSEGTAAVWSS